MLPFSPQMKVWFGLTAIALAGVMIVGISGLVSDEKAFKDLRRLDHSGTQLLHCRFLALELQNRSIELSIYQDLQADPLLTQTQLQRMGTQLKGMTSCLNEIPYQALTTDEKSLLDRIRGHYQELAQSTWLRPQTANSFVLPDQPTLETQLQQPVTHLTQNLSMLAHTIEQRTENLYRQQRDSNRHNHIMILIFGSATGLIVQGLAAFTYKLVNKQSRLLQKLETLARTDPLTGIANRRVWDEELGRALERARRSRLPVSVALLDLDHFKRFNDTFGHQAGDTLLREFGRLLKTKLREGDLIARYGGEEFAMLLHGCPAERAFEVINRMREWVPYNQTFSAGITVSDGYEVGTSVVARADTAMYEAKSQGRNCSVILSHEGFELSPSYHPSSTTIQQEKK